MRVKKKLKKILIGFSIFIVLIVLILALAQHGLNTLIDEACGNTLVQSVLSPDGHLKAVVFVQDCSALDGETTQVGVIPAGQKQPHAANVVFLADIGGAPMELANNIPIHVSWSGNHELRIAYHARAEVQHQNKYLWVGSGFLRGELVNIRYSKMTAP